MMRKNTIFSPKRNRITCFYRSIIKQWGRKILRLPNNDVPVISAKNACFFVAFLACETQDLRLYLVSVPMLYARCDVPEDARNEYVLRTIASEHSSNVNSACTCYLHADVSLTANTRVFGDFANALSVSLLYYMPSKTGSVTLPNGLFRIVKRAFRDDGKASFAVRNTLSCNAEQPFPRCAYG